MRRLSRSRLKVLLICSVAATFYMVFLMPPARGSGQPRQSLVKTAKVPAFSTIPSRPNESAKGGNVMPRPIDSAVVPATELRIESCVTPLRKPPYSPPGNGAQRDSWQVAEPGVSYAFSAFLDDRGQAPVVKILGIGIRLRIGLPAVPNSLKCRMWVQDSEPYVVRAALEPLVDMGEYKHRPVRWVCKMEGGPVPYAVSLVNETCAEPIHSMYVHNTDPEQEREHQHPVNFTICVPTMYKNYDNVHELVEMVEISSMFGANKIVLYNYTTGPNIQAYLRSYQREGKVDIVQWDIPSELVNPPSVHNHGLMAVINDCVYRNMYKSKYVVVADLDELIVPRQSADWPEMLAEHIRVRDNVNNPLPGALSFRCVFFRKEMLDENLARNATIRDLQIRSLLNTKRETKVWGRQRRSKYIVPPQIVDVAGVHVVHSFIPSRSKMSNIDVPIELAFLHHYRLWEDPPSGPPPVLEDTFMHKYREDIVRRVLARHQLVKSARILL